MKFNSLKQLKDWLRNKELSEGIPSNTLLNYYMMERFLERISISEYSDNFIFKGGFLISFMIGTKLMAYLESKDEYINLIESSDELKDIWKNYQDRNKYAEDINWDDIIRSIGYLLNINSN